MKMQATIKEIKESIKYAKGEIKEWEKFIKMLEKGLNEEK